MTDENGELSHADGTFRYTSSGNAPSSDVYFLVPLQDVDYTNSYGLKVKFFSLLKSYQISTNLPHMLCERNIAKKFLNLIRFMIIFRFNNQLILAFTS